MEGASFVTCGGRTFGKIRRHDMTRCNKSIPFAGIRQRRNGDELSLVQTRERRVDHFIRFHDHVRRNLASVDTGAFPDLGARHAWQHRLNLDPGAIKFGIQGLSQA
ncbi:hypothetical protein D3C72_2175520 [compost metagenome]